MHCRTMKYAFYIIVFFLVSIDSNAQALKSIGFKSGISFANQIWSSGSSIPKPSNTSLDANFNFKEKKFRTGIYGALTMEWNYSEKFSLISDFAFCEKGAKYDFRRYRYDPFGPPNNGVYYRSTFTNTTQYFQFELLIKGRKESNKVTYYGLFGPRTDYLYYSSNDDNFSRIKTFGNDFTWGFTAGAGIDKKNKNFIFNSELKYQQDLRPAVDYWYNGHSVYKIRNIAFIFSAGIRYYFKKQEENSNEKEN